MNEDYYDFLAAKSEFGHLAGLDIDASDISPVLKPHQRDIVKWAVEGGRRAIFAAFGLGKTPMQLEIARLIIAKEGGRALIICPLGVRQEFTRDAVELLGMDKPTFVRFSDEVEGDGIYLTNYESVRDGRLDVNLFHTVSLDEASVLRSFGSKTYQTFLALFDTHRYRFVATATPSPNRYKELIHYAGFLGVMDTGAALTRFFQRDSTTAGNLQLHPHKEREFHLWLSSWAIFLQKPSDIGYSDDGYDLPPIQVNWHEIAPEKVEYHFDNWDQGQLIADATMSLGAAAREKRATLDLRVAKAKEIVDASPDDHFILWHDLEDERRALKKAMPEIVEVYGSLDLDTREDRIVGFSNGGFRLLATKPQLSGSGCNFQRHCHRAIFTGVGFKFNDFIQACHRIYRFLQTEQVVIDIIYAESERGIVNVLKSKWERHDALAETMSELIRSYGLNQLAIDEELKRSLGCERVEMSGDGWTAVNNDCIVETRAMESESVDLIVTSIPFSNHYEYTPCYDEETEVLTRRGWLSFGKLSDDDLLATVNPVTLMLEWQIPTERVWRHHTGPMLHFTQRNSFDLLVTPEHKMWVESRVGNVKTGRKRREFHLVRADEISRRFTSRKWAMATTVRPGKGDWPEVVEIAAPNKRRSSKIAISDVKIEDFVELAGWYLTEGCLGAPASSNSCDRCGVICKPDARWCSPFCRARAAADRRLGKGAAEYQARIALRPRTRTSGKRGAIIISQYRKVHPLHWQQIVNLFERIGLTVRATDRGIETWDIGLAEFLREQFGSGSANKHIPRWVKDLDPALLVILRDTMMKGDGNSNGYAYTSVSDKLRDDFQEICLLTGWRTEVVRRNSGTPVVRIGQTNLYPQLRSAPKHVEYAGMIGCATVPNHTLIVRRNGCAVVSGNSYNDLGHTDDNDHFWRQMDFLTPELLRVLRPGRLYCCHVKDRILFGNVTGEGVPTVSPFHAEAIFNAQKHGFQYLGMVTVVTDVVRENNQTYRLGWSENAKDSTKMGVGSPEYVLLFRRPQTDKTRAYADVPVTKDKTAYTRSRWQVDAHAFWRSSGDRLVSRDDLATLPAKVVIDLFKEWSRAEVYDHEVHVKIGEKLDEKGRLPSTFMSLAPVSAHPDVWDDIARMKTLNSEQSRKALNMHICPFQIDIVDRLIRRYSNEGDLIYDPFGGLMTVPVRALKLGRRGYGAELNPGYFRDGVRYLVAAEQVKSAPSLFDLLEVEAAQPEPDSLFEVLGGTLDEVTKSGNGSVKLPAMVPIVECDPA